ncbi:MAG: preprotein translocase subunit SecG [Clostridia bacterium]|nr:preprotein translocase subunit SecG [Clostridia bacterium]
MDGREIFYLVASILLLISAIVLVVVILIQSNSSKGLSGAIAGGSDTYYGRNKGKSSQKPLMIVTIVLTVLFALMSLVIFGLQSNSDKTSSQVEDWWNSLIGNNGQTSTDSSVTEDEETTGETENGGASVEDESKQG